MEKNSNLSKFKSLNESKEFYNILIYLVMINFSFSFPILILKSLRGVYFQCFVLLKECE